MMEPDVDGDLRACRQGKGNMNIRSMFTRQQMLAISLFAASVVITVIAISNSHATPIWDQGFVLYTFGAGYPAIERGISSHILVGLINLIFQSDVITTNTMIRSFSSVLYLTSASLLSWRLFAQRKISWGFFLFLPLLMFSLFPILWLSSEVLAGSFLMFALFIMIGNGPLPISYFFIALYCLAKPDLVFSGFAIVLIDMYFRAGEWSKVNKLLLFLFLLAVFFIPGVMQNGLDFLKFDSGRGLISFSQHYASLVSTHQIVESPDPWVNSAVYVKSNFGEIHSVQDAIINAPAKYIDFIFLSISKSFQNAIRSGLLILVLLTLVGLRSNLKEIKFALMFLGINLLPVTLLSFLHVRYQARLFPLLLMSSILSFGTVNDKWRKTVMVVLCSSLFVLQILLGLPTFLSGYWFPD